MSHTIRYQYNVSAGSTGTDSDFKAMLDWLDLLGVKPCKGVDFAAEVNAILVKHWIHFRDSLTNNPVRYERQYLEQCALAQLEEDGIYEMEDSLGGHTDGQLMAIGRLFYDEPFAGLCRQIEPATSISIIWQIGDVQQLRPDLTDEQAMEVLYQADRRHDAEIGVNWDVLRIHAELLYPESEILSPEHIVESKYAESIIAGESFRYDAIEVHGVRNLNNLDDPARTHYEVYDENPELYSVYVHCIAGGMECVGDFTNYAKAIAYADELAGCHRWKVLNFCDHDN